MERPGLKLLLADVAAGKVDVIVIYKVDRLTRSLADFAKIVEVLDGAGASFVSATQAFNTTTSMGRLMLNVLLSFAQFEREVTGERIRDKVAASKRKGMWMGGSVALGYDVKDRKLVVNEDEAATVRHIFGRYLELRSIGQLAIELEEQGLRSKPRLDGDIDRGSRVFSRGALAHMLGNRLYAGEVVHKGEVFPGEHAVIIDRARFDKVQALIAANRTNGSAKPSANQSLLTGRISDAEGRRMTPVHANKGGRRYRYYVTRPDNAGRPAADAWRLPTGEIDQIVLGEFIRFLSDANEVAGACRAATSSTPLVALLHSADEMAHRLGAPETRQQVLADLNIAITVQEISVAISVSLAALDLERAEPDALNHTILVPARLTRRGHELRMAFPPADKRASAEPDVKLVGLIAKAEAAHRELVSGDPIDKVRRSHLTRLARLRYLAPDIVCAIFEGRHPIELSARKLLRAETIPLAWSEQRRVLGFT